MSTTLDILDMDQILDRIGDIRDTLIQVGGLSAHGLVADGEEHEMILWSLFNIGELRKALEATDDETEAAERDLAVLRQAAAGKRASTEATNGANV